MDVLIRGKSGDAVVDSYDDGDDGGLDVYTRRNVFFLSGVDGDENGDDNV